LGMFLFSLYLFQQLHYSWWLFILLILLPDIGMLGYLINKKVGAMLYNSFHHKGIALMILLIGYLFNIIELQLIGIILFAHASLDRIFGYGLKYPDSFQNTHLGKII